MSDAKLKLEELQAANNGPKSNTPHGIHIYTNKMATQSNKLHQNNKIPKDTNNKQYHK
jgi:hypothetical protein